MDRYFTETEIDKNKALRVNHGNYEASMSLSAESKSDLKWWVENLPAADKEVA